MASCYINPYPKEMSQDEFLLILNANNLYNQYFNLLSNNEDLSDFFNDNQVIIDKGIKELKGLRDFKSGNIQSTEQFFNNNIINYYINNNVDNNILKILDKAFSDMYYDTIANSKIAFSELINVNDLLTNTYDQGIEKNNILISFLGQLVKHKENLEKELLNGKTYDNQPLTESDKLFKEKTISYINSLGIFENDNAPLITIYNLKNNTRLRELLRFLGRDGLFALNDKILDNVNDELENLETNVQIYDKDPLTENPSNKISARLKLMLRGIPRYDLNGNPIKIQNITQYWRPNDLIFELLKTITDKNVHNYSLDQILDKLQVLSTTKENRLSKPTNTFLERLNIVKNNTNTFKNSNLDIYTDLFLYFQQSLVGIKILEEKLIKTEKLDRNGFPTTTFTPDYKLIDKTNFSYYQYSQAIKDLKLNLQNNELLKNNFTPTGILVLKPNQSINGLAAIITDILSPSLLVNKEVFLKRTINYLNANKITNNIGIDDDTLEGFLKSLINISEILNSDIISKVYNVNDDTLFPVISPSELSEEISLINNSINAIKNGATFEQTDFYLKFGNDIVGQSLWADYVKNKGNLLTVSIFTAYKNQLESNEFSNFTRKELLASFFNINNNPNTLHTPILSDKSNLYLIDNFQFGSDESAGFLAGLDELNQDNSIAFFDFIINFIKIDNELNNKINIEEKSLGKNIDKAFKTQNLFLFNPESYGIFNNQEVLAYYNIYTSSDSTSVEKKEAELQLRNIILQVYEKLGKDLETELLENNLISFKNDLFVIPDNSLISKNDYFPSQKDSDKLISDIQKAAVRSYIYTTHLSLLTNGHPAFFKINDEQKRTKAIVADSKKANIAATYKGKTILSDNVNRRIILKDVERTIKDEFLINLSLDRLKVEGLKGNELLSEMAKLFSNATLVDGTEVFTLEKTKLDEIQSKYNEEAKSLQDELDTLKDPFTKRYAELTNSLTDLKTKYAKLEKEITFVKSKQANTTDASSLMSLDFSRKYHVGYNMYSDSQEEFYEHEKSGKKLNKFTDNNFKIIKNIVYTKLNRPNQDERVTYYEKTSTDNFTGERVFLGETPNLYQAMIGKIFGYTFDEKNKSWTYNPNNAISEKVVYESAVKAEMPTMVDGNTIVLDLTKFIKDNNIESLEDINVFKFNSDFIDTHVIDVTITEDRLQVETPEHLEAQGDFGTQIDALIHNAIDITKEYKIGNKIYNGQELTNLINDLKKAGIDIGVKNINNFYNKNTLNNIYDLLSELYEDRNFLNIETLTLEKIPLLLKNPQFGLAVVSKIQSQIKKNVVKTKMNTFQLFNGVVGESDDLKIIIEEDTDSEGKVFKKLIFEVAMPAISEDIFNAVLNPNTGELDANLLPKELKDMIVYRIPTEAIYSMFVIRVKKILHPAAGPIIYMPIGTTTMSGFDMDIDKMFGISKNYKKNNEGKLSVIKYSLEPNSDINFMDWYKENISIEDKAELDELFRQKVKLVENNTQLLSTNDKLKNLLKRKNELIKNVKSNLETNFDLTGKDLSKNISIQLNENEEYTNLRDEIIKIIDSKELRDIDVLQRDFQEINANIISIQKPYKDNWKGLPLTKQMSSKQLQNLYFDILSNVISNSENINTYIAGNNFDRLDDINNINQEKKIKSNKDYADKITLEKKLPYKDKTITNNVNTFMSIMSGSQNIGPTAIMNQFLAYLNFFQNLNQNPDFGFKLNSNFNIISSNQKNYPNFNIFLGLNNMKTKSNQTAALANAVLLAQAVDNVKKDLSVPLNLHKNLMGLRGLLYMIGLDENIVDRLFTDVKLVDDIIKENIKNGNINKFKKNIFKIKNIIDKTGNNLVEIFLDPDTNNYNYTINLETLNKKFNKDKNILDTIGNNITDQDIVKFLSVMYDLSFQLTDLILVMNNFYQGFGKNFNALVNNFLNTQELLLKNNNDSYEEKLSPDFTVNITDSFIKYKLDKLLQVSNNIYKLFNINLNDINFQNILKFLKTQNPMFGNPKQIGYLFKANLSLNLYLNLINDIGSINNLINTYYQEVQDLKNIFSVSKIVEPSINNTYIISKTQNINLDILKKVIRFIDNSPYFLQNNKELLEFKKLYPFNIQFLGQTEEINVSDTPKHIIDIFSTDRNTKYTTTIEGDITEDKVFTAEEIAKKLFFVSLVQSALFSGKTNTGRSNMFEMLFLDNTLLQNSILHTNNSYSDLITIKPFIIDNQYLNNIENTQSILSFILLNNPDFFTRTSFNLNQEKNIISRDYIKKMLFSDFISRDLGIRGSLNNVVVISKRLIPITTDERYARSNKKSVDFILSNTFLIANYGQETKSNLFQKVFVDGENYYYRKLGIIDINKLYSSKENNIAFNVLAPLLQNNDIESNINIIQPVLKALPTSTQPSTSVEREYTPENITSLKPNEVFVFGANTAGGHGGGTAGLAQRGTTSSNYTALPVGTKGKWSEYGVVDRLMQGTEGKSFGIVTKAATISGTSLKIGAKRSVPLSRIEESINALIKTANENPNLKFLVTKFGTNMAGFSEQEMKSLLENKTLPNNVILPKEFEVRTTQPSTSVKKVDETDINVAKSIYNDVLNNFGKNVIGKKASEFNTTFSDAVITKDNYKKFLEDKLNFNAAFDGSDNYKENFNYWLTDENEKNVRFNDDTDLGVKIMKQFFTELVSKYESSTQPTEEDFSSVPPCVN
jgi:hypothetical protein